MENTLIITTAILFLSWIVYNERKFRKEQFYTYLYLRNKEQIDNAQMEMRKYGSTVQEAANALREFGRAMSALGGSVNN